MRSVRLEPELESRLEEAVHVSGRSASDVIRDGIRLRVDQVLSGRMRGSLARRWKKYIGRLSLGGDARKMDEQYATPLNAKHRRASTQWLRDNRKPRRKRP
ncbi:hypothetical protein PHYC_03988 [Phycisphaerales bacterium]|nr:hypothetical protein PHYC_03988 [Phycisphaerales bacterium]